MFTWKFWKDALERAIKTAAQTALGFTVGLSAVSEIDWQAIGLAVAVATVASLLTSLVSSQVGTPENASLVE